MTLHGSFLSQARFGEPGIPVPRFAVIGRGFSGLMMAIALLRVVRRPFDLQLFDPNPNVSGGQALASLQIGEILNSRVRDLSVADGDPDDFNRWLLDNAEFRSAVSAAIPGFHQIFVPKSIFSDYAYRRFSEALASRRDVTVRICTDVVQTVDRMPDGRYHIATCDGEPALYDTVVLATGYGTDHAAAPAEPVAEGTVRARRLVDCPHALLLGSGIRVVDRLFQLRDSGFAGRITILTAHGFLPQSHTRLAADPVELAAPLPANLRDIVRHLRQACQQAEASGQDWQSVMNAFRKQARSLWRSLPARQKRQFNRHLRAIYDSHRNRLPEPHYLRLQRELAIGNTTIRKGRAGRVTGKGVMVRWRDTASDEFLAADPVIDCRCAAPDLAAPLLANLLQAGLAVPDELGLGLLVNATGQLMVDGKSTDDLYAVGPLGLGSLPDIDLVPEIVSQAYAAAERIADRCLDVGLGVGKTC
ncbi:MAG: hypothetical protein BGN83_03365 [Rhizobium sp. 63-7]|nr:MAG: hypothetical protein BGN83_03365 [Rhizobium sp. 63-7]